MVKLASLMDKVPTKDIPAVRSAMGISETTWHNWKNRPDLARAMSLLPLAKYLSEQLGTPVTIHDMMQPLV